MEFSNRFIGNKHIYYIILNIPAIYPRFAKVRNVEYQPRITIVIIC